ncbi:MAG TPA: hypothetical protein VF326_14705, partial [Anaerolineaceae bacterium]
FLRENYRFVFYDSSTFRTRALDTISWIRRELPSQWRFAKGAYSGWNSSALIHPILFNTGIEVHGNSDTISFKIFSHTGKLTGGTEGLFANQARNSESLRFELFWCFQRIIT